MDTVEISRTQDGVPVFIDKNAFEADGIIVVNRIKPHTKFKAPIESGLMKMMAIGMGKQRAPNITTGRQSNTPFPRSSSMQAGKS